jgi:hypothetical protein
MASTFDQPENCCSFWDYTDFTGEKWDVCLTDEDDGYSYTTLAATNRADSWRCGAKVSASFCFNSGSTLTEYGCYGDKAESGVGPSQNREVGYKNNFETVIL